GGNVLPALELAVSQHNAYKAVAVLANHVEVGTASGRGHSDNRFHLIAQSIKASQHVILIAQWARRGQTENSVESQSQPHPHMADSVTPGHPLRGCICGYLYESVYDLRAILSRHSGDRRVVSR